MAEQFEYSDGSFNGSTIMLLVVFLRQIIIPWMVVYIDKSRSQMQLLSFLIINFAIVLGIAETRTYGKDRHLHELWKEYFLIIFIYH